MGADYMDVLRAELTEEVTTRAATALNPAGRRAQRRRRVAHAVVLLVARL